MGKVLVIEDDAALGRALSIKVQAAGYTCRVARTLGDGRLASLEFVPDVICLDVNLPDGNGLDSIRDFVDAPGRPEVLVLSGLASPQDAERAIRCGALDYLTKLDECVRLPVSLRRAFDYRAGKQRTAPLAIELGKMVGTSPAMRACYERLAQAASTEAKVLITGESGTGKELAALAVHSNSRRREKNFVVVDCASLPESLVETVLFGHRKGSFTGAVENRVGLVEQADGGTLFLDEVAELPLRVQKAFLRILQEKKFRPVGSDRETRSDFRLVAATHRDLDRMVAEGNFRADLLFRLRGVSVHLPPLRERISDVSWIVQDAVARIAEKDGTSPKALSPDFLAALQSYSWPGNVRELLNAIEQALAGASEHKMLLPVHLPIEVRASIAKASLQTAAPAASVASLTPATSVASLTPVTAVAPEEERRDLPSLSEHRAAETRLYLQELLQATRFDLAEVCRIAGVSRSCLYSLLKEHRLEWRRGMVSQPE